MASVRGESSGRSLVISPWTPRPGQRRKGRTPESEPTGSPTTSRRRWKGRGRALRERWPAWPPSAPSRGPRRFDDVAHRGGVLLAAGRFPGQSGEADELPAHLLQG